MMARRKPTKATRQTTRRCLGREKTKKSQKGIDTNLDDGYIGANKGEQQGEQQDKQQQIKGGGNHDHLHEL
jgi:hypothetical protein